jgi:hypothetical protein
MKQKRCWYYQLENQRILDEENYTTDYALQTERESNKIWQELAAANKSGADTITVLKHALAKERLLRNPSSMVAALGASIYCIWYTWSGISSW